MNPDELREELELNIVLLLQDMLARGKLTDARAQTISQQVLELLTPGMTFEELYQTVPKLDDSSPELAPITTPIIREYEQRVVSQATDQVSKLIREGKYDAASTLAKQAVKKEVKIEWSGSGKP
jgi:hypothetical protein